MNDIAEYYKGIPEGLEPSINMNFANEVVKIFEGEYLIEQGTSKLTVNGIISFNWFPNQRVIFSGAVINNDQQGIDQLHDVKLYINDLEFGTGRITFRTFRHEDNSYKLSGYCLSATLGDKSLNVDKVTFSIPNFRSIYGDTIKKTFPNGDVQGSDGRFWFEDEKYKIFIDKVDNHDEKQKELKSNGGFLITYGGEIQKKKGSISLSELKNLVYGVSNFLYFFNGRRTSPIFLTGVHEGKELWIDYPNVNLDQYKDVTSWTRHQFFSDLSKLYKNFKSLWQDEVNKDFLETAIHWYVEANSNTAYLEGSIILAQTALELIYNWLVIEQQKLIIGNDAENLSASNKIRLLLSQLKISCEIPINYVEMHEFAKKMKMEIVDAPEVLTRVRNSLIHGQAKKRKDLIGMSPYAKYQALQLALWYVELSILKILNYDGKYCNRVNNRTEIVPWSNLVEKDFLPEGYK